MDFTVFDETEIREIYASMVENMNEEQKQIFIDHYGSLEAFEKHFLENAVSEQAQKNLARVAEWYGSKEIAIEASKDPGNHEKIPECQKQLDAIIKELIDKKDCNVHSIEIQELIKSYDLISQQLYGIKDVTELMLETASYYQTNLEIQKVLDSVWGEGATEFL